MKPHLTREDVQKKEFSIFHLKFEVTGFLLRSFSMRFLPVWEVLLGFSFFSYFCLLSHTLLYSSTPHRNKLQSIPMPCELNCCTFHSPMNYCYLIINIIFYSNGKLLSYLRFSLIYWNWIHYVAVRYISPKIVCSYYARHMKNN